MYREVLLDCVCQIWKTEVGLSGSVISSHVIDHTAVHGIILYIYHTVYCIYNQPWPDILVILVINTVGTSWW